MNFCMLMSETIEGRGNTFKRLRKTFWGKTMKDNLAKSKMAASGGMMGSL